MKRLKTVAFLILLISSFLLSSHTALAQHSCPCTISCSRQCTLPGCRGTCDVRSCKLSSVSPLTFSMDNLNISLSWAVAEYANRYKLIVLNSIGNIIHQEDNLAVNNATFLATAGETYSWTVQPFNWCYAGTIVSGPSIVVPAYPSVTSVTLAYGKSEACSNQDCNGKDIIVDLNKIDKNQKIPIRVTATDDKGWQDISSINILFDDDSDYTNGSSLRIKYTEDGSPTGKLEIENFSPGSISRYPEISIDSYIRIASGNNLELYFELDLSTLNKEDYFLSNIYTNIRDSIEYASGRILQVGTGDTEEKPTDPYAGNAVKALDIWNGKDVAVKNVGFYEVSNYLEMCAQSSLPTALNKEILASYPPSLDYISPLTNWLNATYYQPYYHYKDLNNQVTYSPPDTTYALLGMSSEQYGGSCVGAVGGAVINNFRNGGVREEDGEGIARVGDRSLKTAFAIASVAESWTQIVDGNMFTNRSFNFSGCPTCFLTSKSKSINNGLLLVNGTITANNESHYGDPINWSSQVQEDIKPFTDMVLPSYQELKALYQSGTYTELDGNQTTGAGELITIDPYKTYFIDGDLTVNSSTLVRSAGLGSYLVFIINGNLTITSAVKDSSAGNTPALKAIFIVLDKDGNGTGNITIEDDEADDNDQLTIEGSLIAEGDINIERSLDTRNATAPSVKVVFRPDMLKALKDNGVGIISTQNIAVY